MHTKCTHAPNTHAHTQCTQTEKEVDVPIEEEGDKGERPRGAAAERFAEVAWQQQQ